MMFKIPMWITPLPPDAQSAGGKVHLAQISVETIR